MDEEVKKMIEKKRMLKQINSWKTYEPLFDDGKDPYELGGIDGLSTIRAGAFIYEQQLRIKRIEEATKAIKESKNKK